MLTGHDLMLTYDDMPYTYSNAYSNCTATTLTADSTIMPRTWTSGSIQKAMATTTKYKRTPTLWDFSIPVEYLSGDTTYGTYTQAKTAANYFQKQLECVYKVSSTANWVKYNSDWDYGTDSCNWYKTYRPQRPGDRLREIIRSRFAPAIIIRDRKPVGIPRDHREQAARETLRRVVGERQYRRFLAHGHVSVRAKSGLVYQIFPGHGITRVYRDGEQVERLCVVLAGDFPPTDSLIMRYLVILNDEADFRSHAITHSVIKAQPAKTIEQRNLPQVFKDLKLKLVA